MGLREFTLNEHIFHGHLHVSSDLVFEDFVYEALIEVAIRSGQV